jgi:hypothetical protein
MKASSTGEAMWPYGRTCWVSCLKENFTSSSLGRGWRRPLSGPRQSLTRQLFFKWLKQHLRIKAFFGTTENAVKTQVWIAASVYVLVAITKKRLHLTDTSLYTILQILSISLFEKKPISQALTPEPSINLGEDAANQLELFRY